MNEAVVAKEWVGKVHEASDMNVVFKKRMEDKHHVIRDFLGPNSELFAVCKSSLVLGHWKTHRSLADDGHDGQEGCPNVVDFLPNHLEHNLKTAILSLPKRVEKCLTKAFLESDVDVCAKFKRSGCTATTCIVFGNVLYCANVGDSRAVLNSKAGQVSRLSFDHKAEVEARRIVKLGGKVKNKRVNGVLGLSRSFGDQSLKHLVPARPHVSTTRLCDEHDLLIIGSDGLWHSTTFFPNRASCDFER
jgi:serine/threonine protein phosphatase PrpC